MTATVNSTAAASERELVINRIFDAPREIVFEAWTRAEHLVHWWGPKDFTLPFCEIDFREGGKYRFCMRSPENEDHWVWGEYRRIVEPEELVMTWLRGSEEGEITSSTTVTLTFEAEGQRTKFGLYQALFETVENRDGHAFGWGQCLDRLGAYTAEISNQREDTV